MKLYHKGVFFKNYFFNVCREMLENRTIYTSYHFEERCKEKGMNIIKIQYVLELIQDRCKDYEIFEVKEDKYIEEFAIRTSYDRQSDLCVVFANHYDYDKKQGYLRVKTAWLNNLNDNHDSLDMSKYETR